MFKFLLLLYYLPIIQAQQSLFEVQDTIRLSESSKINNCTYNQSLINQQCQCKQNFTLLHEIYQDSSSSQCQCMENFQFDQREYRCWCPVGFTYSTFLRNCECKGGSVVWSSQLGQNVCVRSKLWILFSSAVLAVIVLKSVQFWRDCQKRQKQHNFKTLYERMSGKKQGYQEQSTVNSQIEMCEWINSFERRAGE